MPSLIASTSYTNAPAGLSWQSDPNVHCFVASTGRRIALFHTATPELYYSTSSDGLTWTTPVLLASHIMEASAYVSDVLYWIGSNKRLNKSTFATGTNLFGAVTTGSSAIPSTSPGWASSLVWDATQSVFHSVADTSGSGSPSFFAVNTSGTLVASSIAFGTGKHYGLTVLPGSPSTVAGLYFDNSIPGLFLKTATFNGSAYTVNISTETVFSGTANFAASVLDNSNLIDIVYQDNANKLYHRKRTGTNTYGSVTNIVTGGVPNSAVPCHIVPDGSGNLYVWYQTTANQANSEIYLVSRQGGTWGAGALAVGGDAAGYRFPRGTGSMTSNRADLTYQDGTAATSSIYAFSYAAASAPNTPVVTAPSGNGTAIVPSVAWTYSNPSTASDPQGAYEIKVVRVSDSVVMWDSGKIVSVNTTLSNSPAQFASTFTVTAATNIAAGQILYVGSTPERIVVGSLASTTVTLASSTVNGATLASATSLAVQTGAGKNFFVGQTIAVDTAGNLDRVVISAISGDTLTVAAMTHAHANGVAVQGVTAAAHSSGEAVRLPGDLSSGLVYGDANNVADVNWSRPLALAYGISYQVSVKNWDSVLNSASAFSSTVAFAVYHAPTATLTQVNGSASNPLTVATPVNWTATWTWAQTETNAANAYRLKLYQNDGVTLVDQTSLTTISPSQANGASKTSNNWSPNGIANSSTYKLSVDVVDAVTGLVATSSQWTLNTSWTPPAAPTSFTVTNQDDLGYMALAWTNAGAAVSVNVLRRPNGGSTWTTLSSGTLRASLKDFCALSTAYDYGVQTVDNLGVQSTITTVTNKTLGIKYGRYGQWLNDLTAPDTLSAALGGIDQWDTSTKWTSHKDILRVVPTGRSKPVTSYGLARWRDTTGRRIWIPASDSGTSGTTLGTAVISALETMGDTSKPLLYRDVRGRWLIVTLDNFDEADDESIHFFVTFDLTEMSSTQTVVVI